jgi:hypothetical protein
MHHLPHVLVKEHGCMDREQVQVWCPLEGPTLDEDLVGLLLVLKKFVIVGT